MTSSSSSKSRWSLQGTTALVTGGTRGIGHAIVEELAELGASIHTCSRNGTELEKCLREWEALGFQVTGSVCDVSSQPEREKLMEKVFSIFGGKLNILINNAGTNMWISTVDYTAEEIQTIKETNFVSAFHLSQLAHPVLKASGVGNIVFISSVAGVVAMYSGTVYAASKVVMGKQGIYRSGDLSHSPATHWRAKRSLISSGIPVHACSAASYIIGQVISVDGGMTVNGFYPTKD